MGAYILKPLAKQLDIVRVNYEEGNTGSERKLLGKQGHILENWSSSAYADSKEYPIGEFYVNDQNGSHRLYFMITDSNENPKIDEREFVLLKIGTKASQVKDLHDARNRGNAFLLYKATNQVIIFLKSLTI